ncbi:hypothetical protein LTR36_003559 [Oleoguttula mirabilis]|uniref:Uncharacterized protein n=1 Tax=Oleoguttula mirabilis TaxID=1507867 RepID=A0AAV9JJR0_9PEZI|nr:hypothetical protein LTR36_003559 [Oleoguttula mirabilis]
MADDILPLVRATLSSVTTPLTDWYSTSASQVTQSVPAGDITVIAPHTGTGTYIHWNSTKSAGPEGFSQANRVWMMHARGESGIGVVPYAVLYIFWSLVVAAGLIGIWLNRERKATKIRDWRCITIAVVAIHLLFTACLIASWIPKRFTCDAVFWVVGLLFPACLAAFQIPNARLVSYYLANKNSGMRQKMHVKGSLTWRYWGRHTIIQRTYYAVIVGLLLQVFFITFMYFSSRRFHSEYGLWGRKEDWHMCLFGFEWVVSIIWQLVWAYGTGIVLLREIRHVKDVYHWALETRIAIFASMPGPLLWSVFMFVKSPTILAVNNNWPPRNWLIPGLVIVQAVLVSFPLWDACKTDARNDAAQSHNSTYGIGSSIGDMINIIDCRSEPLVNYAASTRFNAELIIFLRDVKRWRTSWTSPGSHWVVPRTPEERVACYKHAALIYFKLVHPRIAAFAINVDAKTRSALAEEFKYARYVGVSRPSLGRRDSVAPWTSTEDSSPVIGDRTSPLALKGLEITMTEAEGSIMLISPETLDAGNDNIDDATTEGINLASYAQQDAPDTFTLKVFDEAYKEVKLEAYYNVWLPYFRTGRYAQDFTASTNTA